MFGQTSPRGTDRRATDARHLPILARRVDGTCFMTDRVQLLRKLLGVSSDGSWFNYEVFHPEQQQLRS
jgi:hypothetical protein